jgi:DNA-binding PadR family transcriptional regulator
VSNLESDAAADCELTPRAKRTRQEGRSITTSKLAEKLKRRTIQDFMDIFILSEIQKSSLSGYDVIALIHRKFGVLMSSGTVYSLLYSLEREGWIKGAWNQRKRVYELADKTAAEIKIITKANEEIQSFLRNIQLLNANPHA